MLGCLGRDFVGKQSKDKDTFSFCHKKFVKTNLTLACDKNYKFY